MHHRKTIKKIESVQNQAKSSTLRTVAILPAFIFLCYLGLVFYFRFRGSYKPVMLDENEALPLAEY